MKLFSLIFVLALTGTASAADDGFSACLGFPSAEKFNCSVANGKTYLFDIPEGSGCMVGPATGLVDGIFVIHNPSVGYKSVNGVFVPTVTFTENSDPASAQITVQCVTSEDL